MARVFRQVLKFSALQLFLFLNFSLYGVLNFDSRFSTIRVRPGATLLINNPVPSFTGTLKRDVGGTISGQDVTFVEGLFEDAGNELLLSAVFDPSGIIYMSGGDTLRASPGQVLQSISVSSTNNRIEGAPVFTQDITLADSGSELTLAIQSDMSSDIILADGTLRLANDLSFINEKNFTGDGTIYGSGYRLKTGSKDFTWTNTITLKDGTNLELRADKVTLTGNYTFEGVTNVNGHGNVLDLDDTGVITVPADATLHLNDVTLKGIGTSSFALAGATSVIKMSNVNIEIVENISTTVGIFHVKSGATWFVKDYTWNFGGTSKLEVDGVTLWTDVTADGNEGDITFSAGSNVDLINDAAIKAPCSCKVITSRLEDLESCCEVVDSRVEELESCCENAQSRIEVLEESSGGMASCLCVIESRLDELESCCEVVDSRVEELESCCEWVESIIDECCPDCVIHVKGDTFFDPATFPEMLPAANSAVVFRFEPCWGWTCGTDPMTTCLPCVGIPRLIFDKSNLDPGGVNEGKVLLPDGSRMIFQGEGIVEVRDGIEFTSANSFLPICEWPHVIIEERAMMKPVLNADVLFTGWLNVNVRDAGMLWLDQTSHVMFGAGLSEFFATSHQINLEVDAVGSVIVDDPGARVTFQQAVFTVEFSRSSLLSILDGRVEINSNDGIYLPGTFASLKFSEGANLEIRRGLPGQSGGLLRLSPNLDNQLLNFDNRTGVIDGGGYKTFGKGNIQFIADDLTGSSGIGLPLQGLFDTTIRIKENFYQATDTIVEQFLDLGLVLKSGEAGVSPSDIDIIVQLGSEGDNFAAIDPRRTGSVLALQEGDHDVAYENPSAVPGVGAFPIIGLDTEGDFFEIDENGVRRTIYVIS